MVQRLCISIVLIVLSCCSTKPIFFSDESSSNKGYFNKRFNDNELVRFYSFSDAIEVHDIVAEDSATIANVFFQNYVKPYGKTPDVIKSIRLISKQPLFSLGESSVFSVNLSEELPSTWPINSLLIFAENGTKMFLLSLKTFEPVRIKNGVASLLSGRRLSRGLGDFVAFKLTNDTLFSVFESDLVSKYKQECTRIKNGDLKLLNEDINQDGLFDLNFSGIIYEYCEGHSDVMDSLVPKDSTELHYTYFGKLDAEGIASWLR
jgi:hypothetical protein